MPTWTGNESDSALWGSTDSEFDWDDACSIIDSVCSSPTKSPISTSSMSARMWAARSPSPLSRGQASQPEVKQKGKGKGKSTVIDIEDDIDMKEVEEMVETDVESPNSPRPPSLFSNGRTTSMDTEFTSPNSSFTTPCRKRTHTDVLDTPTSVATPPPDSLSSPSPLAKNRRRDPNRKSPIQSVTFRLGSPSRTKREKGPKVTTYPRGPKEFLSPREGDDVFSASPASTDEESRKTVVSLRSPLDRHSAHSQATPISRTVPSNGHFHIEPSTMSPPAPLLDVPQLATNLNCVTIAHSQRIQRLMDYRRLPWGVQFEIARGISQGLWTWDDVTPEKLDQLKGSSADAAVKVESVIIPSRPASTLNTARERAIWQELDREQAAINEGKGRGIGLLGDWQGAEHWYGGKIQQTATLVELESESESSRASPSKTPKKPARPPQFSIKLDRVESTRSHGIGRFYGSRRILQVRIDKKIEKKLKDQDVMDFMSQKFVICGRVFVPFDSKDSTIYMVETNEDVDREPVDWEGDQYRMSFSDFVKWFNPLHLNYKQPMSKWCARWDLGLSTSAPAIEFEAENIFFIRDQVVGSDPKPPAELVLTDGCGFINGAALSLIGQRFSLEARPTAVQGRVVGSKGLWILHPTDRSPTEPPRIWIRESQRKIFYEKLDRSHRVFALVAPARVTAPQRLSQQSIINLAHGRVPHAVFEEFMRQSVREIYEPLTQWKAPRSYFSIYKAVYQAGRVGSSRSQQLAQGLTRVLGVGGRKFREDAGQSEEPEITLEVSDPTRVMHSLHESALRLLQSGFHPLRCRYLCDKLKLILRNAMESSIKEYRMTLPVSADAFIAPDPFGVLKEGQIFFKSSKPLLDPETGAFFNIFRGDVIVMRYPIDQAYHIRKMVAVDCLELNDYPDVIFFSTTGNHSPASDLGGGDYDGDDCVITLEKRVTQNFKNSEVIQPPPEFITENFEKAIETVEAFLKRDQLQPVFQKQLLKGAAEKLVGLYHFFHSNSTYKNGYDHPETQRLGWMFTTHLDALKSGLRHKKSVLEEDRKKYGGQKPRCMRQASTEETFDENPVERGPALGLFILDILLKKGNELIEEHMQLFQKSTDAAEKGKDEDLCRPYLEAERKAARAKDMGMEALENELDSIKKHVRRIRQLWPSACHGENSQQKPESSRRGERNKAIDDLVRKFKSEPADLVFLTDDAALIKASFAYLDFFTPQKSENFAFRMDFDTICEIKARANGSASITRQFGDFMAVPSSIIRVLAAVQDQNNLA